LKAVHTEKAKERLRRNFSSVVEILKQAIIAYEDFTEDRSKAKEKAASKAIAKIHGIKTVFVRYDLS